MELEIILPILPLPWNKLKGYGYHRYKKNKDEIGLWVLSAKQKLKNTKLVPGISIKFIYGFTNDKRRDVDAFATKPIVDSLVDIGLLKDDHKKILVATHNEWEYTGTEQTRMIIRDGLPIPKKLKR